MLMFIINIANLVGMNLEIGTQRLVLEGKPLHQFKTQFEGFPMTSFCPKTSTFRRQHEVSPFPVMPLWNEKRYIIVKIFLRVLLSLTIPSLKQKGWTMMTQGMSNQPSCNIELHPSKLDFALQNSSVGDELLWRILCHVAKLFWLSLPLSRT